MNSKFLTYFAAASIVTLILAAIFNSVALFAIAFSATVVSILVTDYTPGRCYHRVMCSQYEHLPFAA